jgi:hypothetical protein
VDEIHIGKKQKSLMVVCNLETGEPLWVWPKAKERNVPRDGYRPSLPGGAVVAGSHEHAAPPLLASVSPPTIAVLPSSEIDSEKP